MIDATDIRNFISYDPSTGIFTRARTSGCKGQHKAGTLAGSIDGNGYLAIKIDGRTYKAHRIAWAIMTGEWPALEIDHKNGERADNRWCNLRHATRSQNQGNAKKRKDCTSGFKGVYRHKNQWRAVVVKEKTRYHVGLFDSPSEAHAAYLAKAKEVHGEFARAA